MPPKVAQMIKEREKEKEEQKIFKEFEELGYKWKEDEIFITLINQKNGKCIKINKNLKDYKCYDLFMTPTLLHTNNIALWVTLQEHQLLHRLFEIWGWFNE